MVEKHNTLITINYGSGGSRPPRLCMRKMPPEENETKHQKMTGDDSSHGKGDRQGNKQTRRDQLWTTHQRPTWNWQSVETSLCQG